jgi:hypothetical protein
MRNKTPPTTDTAIIIIVFLDIDASDDADVDADDVHKYEYEDESESTHAELAVVEDALPEQSIVENCCVVNELPLQDNICEETEEPEYI